MLISMTGFGSSSYEDSNLSINIELKSFNSRYFELNTKSFDLSGSLEYKVRNYLKKQLFRGSISLFIKVDSKDTFKFNSHKTSSVLKAYKEIEKKHDIELNYSQLLRNNDILTYIPHSEKIQNKIFSCLKDATKELIVMRKNEGSMIEKEYPDHGILGEEFDSVNPDAEFIWVIDPIDGTRSYIAGHKDNFKYHQ